MCARMARAYAGAAKMIQEKPDEVLEILKKRFAEDGPAAACRRLAGGARRRMPRTSG